MKKRTAAPPEDEPEEETEFDRISRKVKERERRSRAGLNRALDNAVVDLGIDPDHRLSSSHARLLLELLGLELNEYQREELDSLMGRSHAFGVEKLRSWIMKNRQFILYPRFVDTPCIDAERSPSTRRNRSASPRS